MPAGIPEPAKDRTSRDVKSGAMNVSLSKSLLQGSLGIISGAAYKSIRSEHFSRWSSLT